MTFPTSEKMRTRASLQNIGLPSDRGRMLRALCGVSLVRVLPTIHTREVEEGKSATCPTPASTSYKFTDMKPS